MTRAIALFLLRNLFPVRARASNPAIATKAVAATEVARNEDSWCEQFIRGTGDFFRACRTIG
jgi:hypothetical protein